PGAGLAGAGLGAVSRPKPGESLGLAGAASLAAAIDTAASWGPPVVVKLGANGAIVAGQPGGARPTEVTEGISKVRVRDRTGAGDAFAGALIGALCKGASITEAAAVGNAAGSAPATRLAAL